MGYNTTIISGDQSVVFEVAGHIWDLFTSKFRWHKRPNREAIQIVDNERDASCLQKDLQEVSDWANNHQLQFSIKNINAMWYIYGRCKWSFVTLFQTKMERMLYPQGNLLSFSDYRVVKRANIKLGIIKISISKAEREMLAQAVQSHCQTTL